ncbi:MAG: hypothetical protein R6W91_04540 [Thermoplasmata archaeon]
MAEKIILVGAVRGLASEGERVASIIRGTQTNVLALSISREGLETMKCPERFTPDQTGPANPEEEIYISGLSAFGEVVKPPPCFSMALGCANAANIPIEPLDMDDEHYTAAYCKYVTTLDMMRQGSSRKRLARYVFIAETPQDFVKEWDGLVNRLKGYRELENAREEWLAKGIGRLAEKHDSVLAIIELERLDGVKKALETSGCGFEEIH